VVRTQTTRLCPYCQESIAATAARCPFCAEALGRLSTASPAHWQAREPGPPTQTRSSLESLRAVAKRPAIPWSLALLLAAGLFLALASRAGRGERLAETQAQLTSQVEKTRDLERELGEVQASVNDVSAELSSTTARLQDCESAANLGRQANVEVWRALRATQQGNVFGFLYAADRMERALIDADQALQACESGAPSAL
jgi:hypothetical protein